ncbi:MAG: PPC domain-containing DNA-binding protein [Pseudomonadota bacterium]
MAVDLQPIRLHPGDDLRHALVQLVAGRGAGPAFVVSGIGSLVDARLRFAGEAAETIIPGPLEIISISGSVTLAGAHLHIAVSDCKGQVVGGHVGFGTIVRTTVEAVLVFLPEWNMTRELDPATGFDELLIRPRDLKT